MKWRSRIVKELIRALFLLIWVFVISEALTKAYPMFPLLSFGVISPVVVVLIHLFLLWRVPPPKGRTKYSVIAILGMMVWIPLTGLLAPVLGPVGLIFILIGFIIWAFGLRQTWGAVRHAPSSNKEALERRAPETPKSFMKKCAKCGREIPIASEQCPFCGQTQP